MAKRELILAALATAAFGLAACEEGAARRERQVAGRSGGGSAEGLCKPFTSQASMSQAAAPGLGGAMIVDGSTAVDDCLHRWGYTLARSEDDASSVASAVVAACSAPLTRWNQQSLGMAAAQGGGQGGFQQAPSLLTGEPTNPILEHANFAEGRALFYVVQARAGDCEPPRVGDREDREERTEGNADTAPTNSLNSPDR